MKGALAVLLAFALLAGWGWWTLDVSATQPHSAFVEDFLHETVEHAVRRSAAEISPPPGLDDPALMAEGAHHYFPMCEGCHAGPGVDPSELAEGLYPPPPSLHEEEEWSDAELFWIVKNGIKASGMPAYGGSHSDEELWGIVAFARTLPGMTPAAYEGFRPGDDAEMGGAAPAVSDPHDHGSHDHAH